VRDLAPDVLRHRLVLSYEALSDGVAPDELLARLMDAVDAPGERLGAGADAAGSTLTEAA
jgi:MoxR-like ATPase